MENTDLALLTETKAQHENSVKISGFNAFCKSSQGMSGGLAILIRKNFTVEVIKDINIRADNIEHLWIKITNSNPMINLVVIYRKLSSYRSREQKSMERNIWI